MAFEERIRVLIQSVFDSKGFDQLNRRFARLMEVRDDLQKRFNQGIGLKNIGGEIDQLKEKFTEGGMEVDLFKERMEDFEEAADKASNVNPKIPLKDDASGGDDDDGGNSVIDNIVEEEGIERVEAAKESLKEMGMIIRDQRTGRALFPGEIQDPLADAADRFDKNIPFRTRSFGMLDNLEELEARLRSIDGFSINKEDLVGGPDVFQSQSDIANEGGKSLRRVVPDLAVPSFGDPNAIMGFSGGLDKLADAGNTATTSTQRLKKRGVGGLKSAMSQAAGGTRALQMRLLGLQFTMLTVAFIFGGLLASALGAVGAFQILGNTLKFLFLPTALSLLDPLLSIQDRVFNLDEETRKFIGDAFALISVVSIAIGVFAALAQPIVGLVGTLVRLGGALSLGGAFSSLITFLGAGGSSAAGLAGSLAVVKGAIGTMVTVLSGILGPLLLIVGVVIALVTAFQRFPEVRKLVTNVFDHIVASVTNAVRMLMSIIKGVVNVISGLTTFLIAVFTGDMEKMKAGLKEVLFGLGQIFVDPLLMAVNFIGNNVIPAFGDVAHDIISVLVDTFAQNAGFVKDAILSLVPAGIRGMVNNFLGDTAGELHEFIDEQADGLKKFGEGFEDIKFDIGGKDIKAKSGKKDSGEAAKKEQNNTFNVKAMLQNDQDTTFEQGRKFGEGISRGMVNKGSNFNI